MSTQENQPTKDGPAETLALETGSQLQGAIYASCGHKLTDDEGGDGFGFSTITLGDDCDFDGVHRCSFHGSACQKCYDEMKARNILATKEEAERWIRDGILPERMREDSANTPVSNAAKVTEQQNGPSSGVAL